MREWQVMEKSSIHQQLDLSEDLAKAWQGTDALVVAFELQGTVVRRVAERSTIRTQIDGRTYYVKRHGGVGWTEILKNLLSMKRPVVDASNEYIAIREFAAAGLHTLTVAGYGCQGLNPATRRSFLVTEELTGTQSLEQVCLRWIEFPPSPAVKRALIERVASLASRMHATGFVHQDFYICHMLLAGDDQEMCSRSVSAPIYIVDLHRAQRYKHIPLRALVKDLGGLYFSALQISLTRRDVLRFLQTYFELPLRVVLSEQARLLVMCERRATRLHKKARRKHILPRQLAGIDL